MEGYEEDFAALLGRYRVRAGLKQQELATKIGVHRNTIVNWENRTKPPEFRSKVLQLADELSLSKAERKAFIQAAGFSLERWPTEVWTVPQQRDMFFTGRDKVFQSLRELLVSGSTTALTQAISGLGGIGKTHTAVEYAYRFHKDYEAVLWLQADSWEVLVSECINLADELGLPERKEADQVVAEVQDWLWKHRHWLLILDNVDNPQDILPKFVPTGHQGSVLVTTRVHNTEPLAQTQVLSTMSEREGVLFLLRRTKRIAPKAGLEKANSEQYEDAKQIWRLLDGLPLALDQAGAYILETGSSFLTYQEQYTRRRKELLLWRGKRFIGHEASVATTFSLAFERVEALNPVATDILRVCSLLHSEAIPEELFQEGVECLGPRLAAERDNWNQAIGVLQDYSLVQRNSDTKTLTVHRLVQVVLRDAMSEETQREWAERIMLAINAAFPDPEKYDTWLQSGRILTQATVAAQWIEQYHFKSEEAVHLLSQTASYLKERARYEEAESLLLRALHISEQQLGPEHPQIASLLVSLASLHEERGKATEAESLYQRALRIREQQSDPEQLQIALLLDTLAILYEDQGRYAEAEPLMQQALRIREQSLGDAHPDVAFSLTNIASLYKKQGKDAEAESLMQQALRISEQQLGLEHPDVTFYLKQLASLYTRQGKYEEAEPLLQRALRILEQQLSPEHPDLASSFIDLAYLCIKQGKYSEAELLYQRALRTFEQQLGPEHPKVAFGLGFLAGLYTKQGKYTEAEPLLQRALHIWEQQFGPEHPELASTLNFLADLYLEQNKHTEAEPLLQRALRISEEQLGPEDPQVAYALQGLATLSSEQGKDAEAEPLLQRALRILEQQLGPEHPQVAPPLRSLANLYREQGKYREAELLYQRAQAIQEQRLGPDHPQTAETLHDLATFQEIQGNHQEALSLYHRAFTIREQVFGPEHPTTEKTHQRLTALRQLVSPESIAPPWHDNPLEQSEQNS